MTFIWVLFFFFITLYLIVVLCIVAGWSKSKNFNQDLAEGCIHTRISVIVAVRNESNQIDQLVTCLKNQNYPATSYEIIFVDDHSEDRTFEKLNRFIKSENVRVLLLPDGLMGKKSAIAFGVSQAKGELCVFTDADCQAGPEWLSRFDSFYQYHSKPDMIIGLVDLLTLQNRMLTDCFRLEFVSLVISGAGLANIGLPVYCNGANLAIKRTQKTLTQELMPDLASGDDVFLLHSFKKEKKKIEVLFSPEHIVYSKSPETIMEFLRQRIRWASKATSYKDFQAILLSLVIFFTNLFFVAGYILGPLTGKILLIANIFILKAMADTFVFYSGAKILKINRLIKFVLVVELVYPFYIIYTGLLAIKKPFEWKGRKYRN